MTDLSLDRRTMFKGAAVLTLPGAFPAWARSGTAGLHPAPGVLSGHSMKMFDPSVASDVPMGPGVATLSSMPVDRTADRSMGLEEVDHRVLTHADLRALEPNEDIRTPTRSLDIYLTANMER
ncbi:hypothetical protein ASE85_17245 [Sphingobium sp. Leaf26]|nr:hypothetical protein [Sphingobium sp. Leaf26]KQN07976.1 hypothetical protein ASE85_17245 [Sphingobium sp. Leaf26]